jgi:hypothetical protein
MGGENDVIGTEGVEGPVVTIAWMRGRPGSTGSTPLVLKGRGDVRDSERPALSPSEENRIDVLEGTSGKGLEVGDGMRSVSRPKVLTREARGVEGGEVSSSSLTEEGLKKRIPWSGMGVVV